MDPSRGVPPETLQERLVLALVNEAAACLESRVAGQAEEPRMLYKKSSKRQTVVLMVKGSSGR